jgi:Tfp pilus assembly protein PilF
MTPGLRRYRLIAAVVVAASGLSGAAAAAPFIPSSDDVVLEHLPDAQDQAGRALRRQHTVLAHDPHNLELALDLARADIDRARATADPRWLGRAEAALAPWPLASPQSGNNAPHTPASVILLRAVILQSNHDFDHSLAALSQVLKREPRLAQAWLVRASVEQVRADYPAALADCGQLASLNWGLASDTCTAAVMSLTGHAPLALKALSLSLNRFPGEPDQTRLWALTLAAEIAGRLGDASAEQRFAQALAVDPSDPYLLGAWADWLLDRGRPIMVEQLLQDHTRADPLLLRLALAEQALGRSAAAVHIADLGARFEAGHLRGESIHQREEARYCLFLLHQPEAALALAQANWAVQREPADARILAEAARAAGKPDAAAPVTAWLAANSVQDEALRTLLAPTHSSQD